ncbi:MAG: serine/threonine protein kinase [Burkholderiaceae bacterium]|nr:serine/threonine protein kinase [Burkholderiaceae bacterium]
MTAAASSHSPLPGYAGLDPDCVLRTLDALGLRGDGRLLQLNSYENRVFQVFLEDGGVVVAKFYRPSRWSDAQILEEHAFACELAAEDVPVVAPRVLPAAPGIELLGTPPTLARWHDGADNHRVAVSDRHAGRAPELEDPAVLQWLGRFLGRLHIVGARQPFAQRRSMDAATFGHAARQRLLDGSFVPDTERAVWSGWCDAALDRVDRAFSSYIDVPRLRLHGDFHPGNIMWRDAGPHVVDLDDACSGPAVQDLWMLLSGDAVAMRAQLAQILAGYRVFRPFDERELALIEPLRTLRMIHHSAWIAERWTDPAFPAAFPWFGSAAYWSQQATQLREQVQAMDEPPLLS